MLWSILTDHWFQSLMMLGLTRRFLPSGSRSRALAGGRKSMNLRAKFEILPAGITLPGKGSLVDGSRMFLHFVDSGLVAQNGELVGKIPVPFESSARFPSNWALEGYRPCRVCPRRFLSPS